VYTPCINQGEKEERSLQVKNMYLIYSKAKTVMAWVGDMPEEEAWGVELVLQSLCDSLPPIACAPFIPGKVSLDPINLLVVVGPFDSVSTSEGEGEKPHKDWNRQEWTAVQAFLSLPYWTRVWIIQGVAVVNRVELLYGGVVISCDDMAKTLKTWRNASEAPLSAQDFLTNCDQVVELREMYRTRRSISLFGAIPWTHKAQATLEHDRIFGLLGLSDGANFVRLPNYEQDLNEMLQGMTAEMMPSVSSLDLIYLGGISTDTGGLPTWIPSLVSATNTHRGKTHRAAVSSCSNHDNSHIQ